MGGHTSTLRIGDVTRRVHLDYDPDCELHYWKAIYKDKKNRIVRVYLANDKILHVVDERTGDVIPADGWCIPKKGFFVFQT